MGTDRLDIVGLGLATLDVLIRCEPTNEESAGIALRGFHLEGGGPVATALCAAQKLGARTGFVGTAGGDFAGEAKVQSLIRRGVDVSRVIRRADPEPWVVLVQVDAATGERRFSMLEKVVDEKLRPDELDRDYITQAAYLHLDGFHTEAAMTAARWMHEAGKQVVLDAAAIKRGPVRKELRELARHVDVLICGIGYTETLTGESAVEDACRAAQQLGPRVVVQTDGPNGSYTVCPTGEFHTTAFDVDVVDTTGAGDVFHGAYIVGLLRGWPPERIATFASAVAAMKCTKMGGRAGVGTFEETLRFLKDRGIHLDA